jgi:hypothetical protein
MADETSILSLEQPAFMAALDELGVYGEQRDFLIREKRKHDSFLGGLMGVEAAPLGQKRATILPMVSPQGMTGWDAIMGGEASLAMPGLLAGAISGTAKAIDAPRAAYAGQIPQSDLVSEGFGVGGLLSLGGAATAGRGLLDYDPTVTRVFAGPKAATANKDALARAKRLTAEGASKDQIWSQTGWFQLGDGQWRFEIDDRDVGLRRPGEGMQMAEGMRQEAKDINAFLKQRREDLKTQPDLFPDTIRKDNAILTREAERLRREAASNYGPEWSPATLGQRAAYALTDSELQRAYPDLMRETIVRTNQNLGGPYGGYTEDLGNLELAPESYIRQAENPLQRDPRGTLIHELQHAIQGYEGFSRGTNTTQARELLRNQLDARIKSERDTFSNMFVNADPRLQEILKNYEGARHMGLLEPLIDLELEAFQIPGGRELIQQSNRVLAETEQVVTPQDAFNAYERHLGELEARLAQGRRDWTPQQRAATPPWAMPEYIPDEQQIRSFVAGPSRPGDVFSAPMRGLLEQY